jgi:hypothetical protein
MTTPIFDFDKTINATLCIDEKINTKEFDISIAKYG